MTTARGIFGAILAAGALAAIAAFHHEFWPRAQSPPQQIETVQKTDTLVRPESARQELDDLPKSVHGPEQLEHTARRVREGRRRIAKVSNVIEGMVEHGLMGQERLSKALSVVTNMREAQRLVEQRYEAMNIPQPLSKDDIG